MRALLLCAGILAAPLRADFSYEQTSKITGGSAFSKMKAAGAADQIHTTVAVKGDRMVYGDDIRSEMIDLAKETITVVDFQAETWQTLTFAQVSQALDEIAKKAKDDPNGELHVSVSSESSDAAHAELTADIKTSTRKPRETHHLTVAADVQLDTKTAGYPEAAEFLRRLAEKLKWSPDQSIAMQTSILAGIVGYTRARRAMADVFTQISKMEGIPIRQQIRITEDRPLFEMTTELSHFSTSPVDPARFEIPSGFQKAEGEPRWLLP